jgi:hypothetical protein
VSAAVARALARAEAAGVRFRLAPDGRVQMQAAAPPPPDVLAELRRWRADVAHLLALRAAVAAPPPVPPPPSAPSPAPSPPEPVGWLASIARSIRAALADGAIRVADAAGFLVLVRPDGRHLTVAPSTVAELAAAGLLPELPPPVVESGGDDLDPVAEAEREAIETEPPLPPPGTPARAALDQRQAATVRGLLASAAQRPPCFPGEASRPPPPGARCSCCRGRRWWFPARPKADSTEPSAHWRCSACRPADFLPKSDLVEVET